MKTAVVLYSMGSPERPEEIRPYLFKLFSDPAIFKVSKPLRFILAFLLSRFRTRKVSKNLKKMGEESLLTNTKAQAWALEKALSFLGNLRVYIVMRYTEPSAEKVAKSIKEYNADYVVHLPLYPQFSYCTTGSSFDEAKRVGLLEENNPAHIVINNFKTMPEFVTPMALDINQTLPLAQEKEKPLVLFSAHGLPEKNILEGDPYQKQCEETAAALQKRLPSSAECVLCYQSKVGPMKWIGPSLQAMIEKAGKEKRPVIIAPISFVCEHSETIVELWSDYKKIAEKAGVPFYDVVPTVGVSDLFINGLAGLIKSEMDKRGFLKKEEPI